MQALLKIDGSTVAGLTILAHRMSKDGVQIEAEVLFTGETARKKIFDLALTAQPILKAGLRYDTKDEYKGCLAITRLASKGVISGEHVYNMTFVGKLNALPAA